MYDICCVGHISSDKVITPKSCGKLAGGTAVYFSHVLSKLKINYLLVTSLAPAEMSYVTDLQNKNINVSVRLSRHTVEFENIYGENPDEREQKVNQTADAFTMDQLADIDAKIFHLGTLLADDISIDIIKSLAAKGRVSLDAQGFVRKVINKKVSVVDWRQKKEALQYIDILKVDETEMTALTGHTNIADGARLLADWGAKEVVITKGGKGSEIYKDGNYYNIPFYYPLQITDVTGCGDTYMAGYLYMRTNNKGPQEAGEFAAAVASLKIGTFGAYSGTIGEITDFRNQHYAIWGF